MNKIVRVVIVILFLQIIWINDLHKIIKLTLELSKDGL